ncbi:Ubiquinone biosynthesis monooxygenase COQ6, mitochondrial [Aphelenchoides fujianensis]|nr:Ubiquinone biosynthesis monooxygenase COQ6, mitochondrial [Aphelenchoides fujianensis]
MRCSLLSACSPWKEARRFVNVGGRQSFDVAIVGGGPVGNAMACSLGQSEVLKNKRVILLESSKPQRLGAPLVKYSNRVFACSPASVRMFKDLGIWETLVKYRVKEVEGLYVLDACSRSKVQFAPRYGEHSVSHLIEDGAVSKALYGRILDACPNVEYRTGVQVDECRSGPTGRAVEFGRQMDVPSTGWDYGQMAIVCTLSVDAPAGNSIAWQRFTPLGPIALLPLTDSLSSLVWTSATEDAKRLLSLEPDRFVDELNHYLFTNAAQNPTTNRALGLMDDFARFLRLSERPADPKSPPTVLELHKDSRAAFPVGLQRRPHLREDPSCPDWETPATAFIRSPGQGVNLGWSDVRLLTQCLENATKGGSGFGASQAHNLPIMVTVDWLNRLYRTSYGPLVFLRSLGLHAVDNLGPLKTPPAGEELFVQGGRFGESQSLRESHSLDAVLQREEWRDELVSSSQTAADAPKNDICGVYESYDHTTLAELFLSIQSATTNVHARPFEGVKQGDLKELLRIASPAVVKVAEMNGAFCSAYDVDGLQYEDLELANILKFAHRPRVPTDLDTGLLREIVAVGLPLGRQPARILQLAALFWWAEGSAAESAHCLQRMVLLAESEEQRRDAQFMLAQTFAFCDLFDLAIETFELVAETEPPLPTPFFFLGGLRAFTGDYEGALRDFEQAAALLKKPLDGHRLMGVKFCKCKLRELKRLKAEQESLEKELEELNAFNSAMERKLQLELLIQQKSSRERELINGFLARTEQGRQQLSCRIVNPLDFVEGGPCGVHNDYQRGLGDLSAHDEFFRTYERHRNAQEEEYAAAMIPFLKEVEPYVGLRMDEPPRPAQVPEANGAPRTNSTPIAIDLTTRGYPVGDLLNKYLGLTPDGQHPFPWEMPYCRPFDPTAETSGLWAALKSPANPVEEPRVVHGRTGPSARSCPPDGRAASAATSLLPDFGQRVLTLMKFDIGPRWLLNELATMFFRSLGVLQEALACVAENLNGTEPVHSPHADLALFQLARILHHARPVEGTADDVVFLMKMATLNRHTDDPAVHLLAAVTAKTPEQSLAYLWKAHADRSRLPAGARPTARVLLRPPTGEVLGPPIQNRFLPICCWKTEHDVFCFKRPEQEGACFKIETNVLDDERIEHKFRSFRCSGKYVEHNEKERKLEKERSKRVLPLDYGGFSHARIAYFSRTDAIEQLRSRVDEYMDPEVAAKRKEGASDGQTAEGDEREEEPLRTWDGEIVELDEQGNATSRH